jgi:hypothetical protein
VVDGTLPVVVVLPGIAAFLALVDARNVPFPMLVGSLIGLGYSIVVLWGNGIGTAIHLRPRRLLHRACGDHPHARVLAVRQSPLSELTAVRRRELHSDRWPLISGGSAVPVFALASLRGVSPASDE